MARYVIFFKRNRVMEATARVYENSDIRLPVVAAVVVVSVDITKAVLLVTEIIKHWSLRTIKLDNPAQFLLLIIFCFLPQLFGIHDFLSSECHLVVILTGFLSEAIF
ncbi:hypothetical protein CRM22_004562 [Opisthorchis felineus]|uniref:Uncharacterized protein n=1 Tax=Opisthorchis felineus TaxID=147828 RepID=A0A4S2LVK3_OPIFE|nr:hypothetical protein CRM22_004562 [Opisthorchis felineus]